MRRKPTQGDVARLADVGQANVSYVLTDSNAVSLPAAPRQRILDAARELGTSRTAPPGPSGPGRR